MRKVLSAVMLVASVSLAHGGPKEDAYQVVAKWGKEFTDADVDAIAKLYAPDALMIGTLGKVVLTKPEQIRKYFDVALNTGKPRTATLDSSESLVVDDNTVVITGFDTLTGTKDGRQTIGKGRVTFVVAKRGSDWMIVHLHRSPLPAT
ncbi:SgcJ/EcaC family oxidoreductase [Bradyrhizobium zhanjiangense]|uniref:SgcJ/EcaC family oxidoreductase n=1 Tax=Bradyrhizobium zhanjiangense TaxID=1325107 RepID=UPI001008A259|nr:nuclear transport factor 2 family protein [Bradyrhizobium zhanjiangense]